MIVTEADTRAETKPRVPEASKPRQTAISVICRPDLTGPFSEGSTIASIWEEIF